MAQNLNRPPSGIGSAGNTAGSCGNETETAGLTHTDETTKVYIPASAGSGSLTAAGVSSTQTDASLDEGSIRQDQLGYAGS